MSHNYENIPTPANFIRQGDIRNPSPSHNNSSDLEEHPEDLIPDLPENQATREFLRKAPKHGLFQPLGKEVKVMQCWKCKTYGHRSGDRECPMFQTGNIQVESKRRAIEDPISYFAQDITEIHSMKQQKLERLQLLQRLVEEIREEEQERKRIKHEKKLKKQSKKEEKRQKKLETKETKEFKENKSD